MTIRQPQQRIKPPFKQPLTLFWRLFLSILAVLLVTSALSISIERWITAKELNNRMQHHIGQLLIVRLQVINALKADDLEQVRYLYRDNRRLTSQIRVIDEQGQVLFPRFGQSRREFGPHNPPPLSIAPEGRRPPDRPQIQDGQQISADILDYPELQDVSVASEKGDFYTVQLQPRLPMRELRLLRRDYTAIRIGLIVLFSILVCYWLSRTLTRRIHHVQKAVHLMSDGNFDAGAALNNLGNDELGLLAKDVSKLSDRLAESELARKQMLSDISHELRSPLARLDVATEITRDFAPEANPYLDRIEKESARMNELIEQIIRIQSLQMKRYSTDVSNYQTLDLYQLIDGIREDVCFEFQEKRVQWQWDVETEVDSWSVLGDYEQLRSAFENIIRNAFTHTKPHSSVTVGLHNTSISDNTLPAFSVQVMDEGDGIAETDLQRIFQPFVRLSTSRERPTTASTPATATQTKTSGYGLGLAISQAVIGAHHGHIEAYNRTDTTTGLIVEVILPQHLS